MEQVDEHERRHALVAPPVLGQQLAVFAEWPKRVPPENHETFRWTLEEFRVSIFAQELGTALPVSAKKLMALGDF